MGDSRVIGEFTKERFEQIGCLLLPSMFLVGWGRV